MSANYIYNITTKVTKDIQADWLQWLKEIHSTNIIATGCFTSVTIAQLKDIDDSEGPTYVAQYFTDEKSKIETFIALYLEAFNEEAFARWGNKFISFRTTMQVVH